MGSGLVREGCKAKKKLTGEVKETRPWRSQCYWSSGDGKRLQLENLAFMTRGTSRRCQEVPGTAQVDAGRHQSCRAQEWGLFFGQAISWTLKLPKLSGSVQDVRDETRGGPMAWLLFCLGLEELVGKKLRIMWGWERSEG